MLPVNFSGPSQHDDLACAALMTNDHQVVSKNDVDRMWGRKGTNDEGHPNDGENSDDEAHDGHT
ncbi:MAG: hypothetical protein DMF84_27580 [Acidobacteria bacterium]|nr:MAG: hypothetical protein DMF84_27580 [Acidobacteriota bacterium]